MTGCQPCGQMRSDMKKAIADHDPARIIRVARSAITFNATKVVKGKEQAVAEYYANNGDTST